MRTRLHALAAGWIPVMGELLHVPEHNFESGSQSLKSTPPPTIMLTCQKWIGTIHMASHTQHNSETTLGRNNFPLGLLHLVLTYKCILFYNISPCTGSRVNTIYESMCWNSFIMKFRQVFLFSFKINILAMFHLGYCPTIVVSCYTGNVDSLAPEGCGSNFTTVF